MKKVAIASLILMPLLVAVSGCISSSSPSPPSHTTVVVPNGSTAVYAPRRPART